MHKPLVGLLALSLLFGGQVFAADHLDSPSAVADGATDITDVFAWTSDDGSKLNLIMNVSPNAAADAGFSDAAQYVFHVTRTSAFGVAGTDSNVMCTFGSDAMVQCWAGDAYVMGDASDAAGLANDAGSLKVFAGLRNDPFFFPLSGFNAVAETVVGAAAGLDFDDNGCPTVDEATSGAIVGLLQSNNGVMPLDTFQSFNSLSLAIQIDVAAIAGEGNIMSVWASTRRAE